MQHFAKNINDILTYDQENAIENIVKIFFETILKYDRKEFLNEYNKDTQLGEKNKGNGYYEKVVKCINKYFKLKIPRDRLGVFKPEFLELLKQKDEEMADLAFSLYTKGLTTRDIEQVFKDSFGASFSASKISCITKEFEQIRKAWQSEKLDEEYYFVYMDAIHIAVRRETVQKEAFYIAIGLKKDLTRKVLGVYNIPQESAIGWEDALKDLKERGLKKVLMFIADGLTGLENVVKKEFPSSFFQKCLLHKIKNVMVKVRADDKKEIADDFFDVFKLEESNYTLDEGRKNLKIFVEKWGKKYYSIRNMFKDEHLENYFAYLNYPKEIHRMIYTTNWIERLNKGIRRTEKVRNSFPSEDSALNLICAYLMDFEKRVYKYPVTSFKKVKDILDDMLTGDCSFSNEKDT